MHVTYSKWFFLISSVALAGCAGFHQHYYFKSSDALGNPIDYYRVDVDGGAVLCSSRYLAGYFDESAVNTYFDEVSQPANAQITASSSTNQQQSGTSPSTGATVQPVAPKGKGILVLLLSSNSDEIANGISSLASNQEVANNLTSLVQAQRQSQASQTAAAHQTAVAQASALATLGASTVAPGADNNTIKANLLTYANALASFLQPGQHFTSLAAAQNWLKENASRIAEEKP